MIGTSTIRPAPFLTAVMILAVILPSGIGGGLNAQFPAPESFQFLYEYIMLDEWGMCNDVTLYGPDYCSHFSWSPPDTSLTDARLDSYQVYVDDMPLVSVTDTFYTTSGGFIGKFYVTAVYTDPSGESDSSNVVSNYELPISSVELGSPGRHGIIYNAGDRQLVVQDAMAIRRLRIFDIRGMEIFSASPVRRTIDVSGIGSGLYIIEKQETNNRVFRQKIVIR